MPLCLECKRAAFDYRIVGGRRKGTEAILGVVSEIGKIGNKRDEPSRIRRFTVLPTSLSGGFRRVGYDSAIESCRSISDVGSLACSNGRLRRSYSESSEGLYLTDIFFSFHNSISPELIFCSRSESRDMGILYTSHKGTCDLDLLVYEALVLVVDGVCTLYYVFIESCRMVGNIRCVKCLYRRRYNRHFQYLNIVEMQVVVGIFPSRFYIEAYLDIFAYILRQRYAYWRRNIWNSV